MRGRIQSLFLIVLVSALIHGLNDVQAQTSTSAAEAAPGSERRVESRADDLIYRKGPDGRWQTVPVGDALVPQIADLLESGQDAEPIVPDYFLSELSIDGDVVDAWADLTARIEVRVVLDETWLRVPLRFDQALLLKYKHTGDGDAAPAMDADRQSGLTWLLRGRGVHHLELSLRVPLRQTAAGTQLQLLIPELSEFWAGDLNLRLPADSVVEPTESVHIVDGPQQIAGRTRINATISGQRVDLRWHPVVEESAPISRTLTNITVRLRDNRVELSARQEYRLRSSGLPAVEVRLPTGNFRRAAPVRINEASGAERQVEPVPSDREGWVRVPLEGVVGTVVRLDWQFETSYEGSIDELTIDGLEVAEAEDQSGTISIEGFDRHLLTRRPGLDEGVSRIGVDELPAAGAFANLAYRILRGNYQLVFDVDPVESTFRVTPLYLLELSEFRARLTARFLMSIDEGEVDALSLVWPQFEEQGWSVEPLAVGGAEIRRDKVVPGNVAEDDSANGTRSDNAPLSAVSSTRWLLKPANPLSHGARPGLSAERMIAGSTPGDSIPVAFPHVVGARVLPGILIVATADNTDAAVFPQAGTILVSQPEGAVAETGMLENLSDLSRTAFAMHQEEPDQGIAVDVRLTVRDREVETSSVVSVDDIETAPSITQAIDFNVIFGRLSSVRLRIPETIIDALPEAFADNPDVYGNQALPIRLNGERLSATWRGTDVELTLPSPKRGSFQIVVGPYAAPGLKAAAPSGDIPVVSCIDRPYEFVRLAFSDAGVAAVHVQDEAWSRLTTVTGGSQWITDTATSGVRALFDYSLDASPQQASIPVAWIQSRVYEAGSILTLAQYQVPADLSRLLFRVPSDAETPRFHWNGRELGARGVTELPDIAGQYLIQLPPGEASPGWLSVSYVSGRKTSGWLDSKSVRLPSFGHDVTIERTFLELSLPQTQHLLSSPSGLSPQYQWTRNGFVWRRSAMPAFLGLRDNLIKSGAEEMDGFAAGNEYAFETISMVRDVSVQSMTGSLLVLLGAGLTLIVSFLVLKVPAARSLWVWMTLGATAAVLSLWHLEVTLLLLQPAAFGLILPICAAVAEQLIGRRSPAPEPLSTRASFEMNLPTGDVPELSVGSDFESGVPSTLVRPTALSDSGVR